MALGGYTINVSVNSFPQKVASGFDKAFENMVGAEYTPIAYLGSKVVNGINHLLLAEQRIITGTDVKSVVTVVLNEKPNDVDGSTLSIVEIKTVLSNGGTLGGDKVDVQTEIPEEAKKVFDNAFSAFLGSKVTPIALLASQITNGIKYTFAVELDAVVAPNAFKVTRNEGTASVALVEVWSNYKTTKFTNIVTGTLKTGPLGTASNPTDVDWP